MGAAPLPATPAAPWIIPPAVAFERAAPGPLLGVRVPGRWSFPWFPVTTQPCPGASAVPARWPPVSGADCTSAEWRRTWQVTCVRQRPTRGRRLPRGERAARSHLVTVSKRAQTSGRHPRRSERCPREAWSVTSWRVTSVITRQGRFPQRALLWGPCGAPLWSSGRLGLGISERTSSIRTLTAVGVVTATPGAARCSERRP